MSRSYTFRPTANIQKVRERGRGMSRDRFREAQSDSVRSNLSHPSTRARGFGQTVARAKSNSLTRQQPGYAMNQLQNSGDTVKSHEEDSLPVHNSSGYTVIPPDPKKRQKILDQVEMNDRNIEEFNHNRTPNHVSYVGTVGGEIGHLESRRQLEKIHKNRSSKTYRMLQEEDRKKKKKEADDKAIEEMKESAHKKAELNEKREMERQESLKIEMRRKNNAFLDKLVAQSKEKKSSQIVGTDNLKTSQFQNRTQRQPKAQNSTYPDQQKISVSQQLPRSPQITITARGNETDSFMVAAGRNVSSEKTKSNSRWMFQADSSYPEVDKGAKPKTTPTVTSRHSVVSNDTDIHLLSFQVHDAEFYDNLDTLMAMFPNDDIDSLQLVLEQNDGSLEDALVQLGLD